MKNVIKALVIQLLTLLVACGEQNVHEFTITVRGEDGNPLGGVSVAVQLEHLSAKVPGGRVVRGTTDAEGKVVLSGYTLLAPGFYCEKEGYYRSAAKILFEKSADGHYVSQRHEAECVMRRKVNPVPMYARRTLVYLPESGKKYGYDFQVGDLVQPHGKGLKEMVNLEINHEKREGRGFLFTCLMTFPNEADGWREEVRWENGNSVFNWPYLVEGQFANDDLLFEFGLVDGQRGYLKTGLKSPYVLRVNSVANARGEILSANYCRIEPGIVIGGGAGSNAVGGLKMTYYYNPEVNDRHLEFDRSKNLATEDKNGMTGNLAP